MSLFSDEIFRYYKLAQQYKFEKGWFDKNSELYELSVKYPFDELKQRLIINAHCVEDEQLFKNLKLSRAKRPKNRFLDKGEVKNFTTLSLSTLKKQRFDHVPLLHFQLGHEEHDNYLKVGLFSSSKKELNTVRENFSDKFLSLIDEVSKELGELKGEQYKKEQEIINENFFEFYQFKTFYFEKHYSPKMVCKKGFSQTILNDFQAAVKWYKFLLFVL